MQRDPRGKRTEDLDAEAVQKDEMDTSGHGDKLEDAVNRIAKPDEPREPSSRFERVEEEDMDTRGQGDPWSDNIKNI